jgi:hypothetical protein
MHEVDVKAVDLGVEVRQLVEPRLDRPPVELVPPVPDELMQDLERRSALPLLVVDLVGPANTQQARMQIFQSLVWNLDPIRLNSSLSSQGGSRHQVCTTVHAASSAPRAKPAGVRTSSRPVSPALLADSWSRFAERGGSGHASRLA